MHDLYIRKDNAKLTQAVMAVTVFYLDYYRKSLEVVDLAPDGGLPWDAIGDDTRVYLVGFTPDAGSFERLVDTAGDIVWIDNDMEAVRSIEALSDEAHDYRRLKALRKPGKGLMELAWGSYFAWMKEWPEVVGLVGRYEVGDRSAPGWEDRIVPFNRGLAARDIDPTDPEVFASFWKEVVCIRRDREHEHDIIDRIVAEGVELARRGESFPESKGESR